VVEVCRPGNGRGQRSTKEEIAARLLAADEDVADDQIKFISKSGEVLGNVDCNTGGQGRQSG
jgi:hypothetical protein